MEVAVDQKLNRVSFYSTMMQSTRKEEVSLIRKDKCHNFDMTVLGSTKDIFKPINIKLSFKTAESINETSSKFCEACVVLDPRHSAKKTERIEFATGCSGEICRPEIAATAHVMNISDSYILGSSKTITLLYELSNTGEPAYQPQLSIAVNATNIQFLKIPSFCQQETKQKLQMVCDINSGIPLLRSENVPFEILLDTSKLDGKSLEVFAAISSKTDHQNRTIHKELSKFIFLKEFSDVELIG